MLAAKAKHPNCVYRWMNHVLSPQADAQAAAFLGQAPATRRACELDVAKDACDAFHAGDEDFWGRVVAADGAAARLRRRPRRGAARTPATGRRHGRRPRPERRRRDPRGGGRAGLTPADVVAVARATRRSQLAAHAREAMARTRRRRRAHRRRQRAGLRRHHRLRLARRHLHPRGPARGAAARRSCARTPPAWARRRARGRAGDDAAARAHAGDGLLRARGPRWPRRSLALLNAGADPGRAASTARSAPAATSRRSPTARSR